MKSITAPRQLTSLGLANPIEEVSDDLLKTNFIGLWRWCSVFIVVIGRGAPFASSLAGSREMGRDDGGGERERRAVVQDEQGW